MTAAHLSVEEKRVAGDAVLVLTGEIDIATAGELRAAADRTLSTPPDRLVLDFAGVSFCDSQGLSTLISLNRETTALGSRLVLANVGDFMTRLLEITGLNAAFDVDSRL
ncbi:MAG TPA: STAS domain-containing protein [Micromonosporaceae bacterium]